MTSNQETSNEFLWRWIDRMARDEISVDEALSVLTHHPDAPDWVAEYKIVRPPDAKTPIAALRDAIDFLDKCRLDRSSSETGALRDAHEWVEAAARNVVNKE